jgi:hypothetical protein
MVRRRCVSFASIAQAAFFVATAAVAACSSPANLSGFSKADKDENGTEPGGSFENGSNGGPAGPTAGCVPSKGQYDIPGDKCDNDDDGTVDNPPVCDAALANDGSAEDFARAMGICQSVQKEGFGLVSAKFTRGHARDDAPQAAQHGVLDKFGTVLKPREGKRLGVLSTGYAQEFNGSPGAPFGGNTGGKDWFGAGFGAGAVGNGTAPPGYPKAAAGCPQAMGVNDVISLKLELKAPKNATGIKFDFNFHSGEWPAYICSEFNDGFIAYLSAQGFNGGKPENISFDAKKNPVSVNNGFFDRCTANAVIGCRAASPSTSACPAGAEELAGTGFGILGTYCPGGGQTVSGGATGWLSSQAPVKAGETFTLELMIWDTGDGDLDSSVLLDNFQWIGGEVITQTERPGPVR